MRSFTSRRFRELYADLPDQVRSQARKAYQLFLQDPSHRGLKFKKVGGQTGIYSARVGIEYRALGRIDGGDIVWFWIGPHGDYDNIV